jgi:hypothetical protein
MSDRLSRLRVVNSVTMNLREFEAIFVKYALRTVVCNQKPVDSDHSEHLEEA